MAYTEKTHPLCMSNDGLSAGRPVVRLSVFIRDGEDNGKIYYEQIVENMQNTLLYCVSNKGVSSAGRPVILFPFGGYGYSSCGPSW